MDFSRKYLVWALCYAAAGMGLGLFMAASGNHGQLVTHAHVLLAGFVVSLVYGIIHRLWLDNPGRRIAMVQFVVHQVAAVALCIGLFLLYGSIVPEATLAPVLGIASVGVLLGLLLMLYMVLKAGPARSDQSAQATSRPDKLPA